MDKNPLTWGVSCYQKVASGRHHANLWPHFTEQCGGEFIRRLCQKHIGRYSPELVVYQIHKSPSVGRGSFMGPGPRPSECRAQSSSCRNAEIGVPWRRALPSGLFPNYWPTVSRENFRKPPKQTKPQQNLAFKNTVALGANITGQQIYGKISKK